jgi:hypothetical protein
MNLCGDKNSGIDSIRATLLMTMNLHGGYDSLPDKSRLSEKNQKWDSQHSHFSPVRELPVQPWPSR